MKEYFNDFLLMIQFLTRIPVNKELPCSRENFKRGSIFFPIIGFIIGLVQFVIVKALSNNLPSFIVSIFALISAILLTGALHLDGFGDVFDGFFSFKGGKDKIIEVMKDSRVGTYASAAIFINMILKISFYNYTILDNLTYIILVTPAVSRCFVVLISYIGKNAKKTGSGNIFIGNIDKKRVIINFIITILIMIPFLSIKDIIAILIFNFILTILINKFCEKYICGLTGDTLGFTNEVIEIFTLLLYTCIHF